MFVKRRAKLCLVFALIFFYNLLFHTPLQIQRFFPISTHKRLPPLIWGREPLLGERKNGRAEEFARRIGHYAVHLPIHGNGDAAATALAHAERGLKIHLVMQAIFLNHLLKRLNHVVRAFQMAGTSDTNADFYQTQ